MINLFLKVVIVLLSFFTSKAFSSEMDKVFYWSNAKGLVEADHCKMEASSSNSLRVVYNVRDNHVPLVRNSGQSNLSIVNESLVKISDTDINKSNRGLEVVAVNNKVVKKPFSIKGLFKKEPLKVQAMRGDEGSVDSKYLKDLTNYSMKNNDYSDVLGGAYWRVYFQETFVKLNCPEFINANDYIIFNVYNKNNSGVISRVAVSASETELFKDVSIFQNYKADNYDEVDLTNTLDEIINLPGTSSGKKKSDKPNAPSLDLDLPTRDKTDDRYNEEKDVTTQNGTDTIICTQEDYINVRNKKLTQVIFTASPNERIKVFQGWGRNEIEGEVDGKTYTYKKVEFIDKEDRNKKIGYVVSTYVKAKSDCHNEYSNTNAGTKLTLIPEDTSFTGLNDKNCCNFPTMKKVTTKFNEGMRRFGGARDGGARAHAAVDLYRYVNEPIFSVAPGVVISNLYYFYQGTFALEVLHSGGFVVRYGELTGEFVNDATKGKQVKMGDRLGYIGKVNSNCCSPMVHFELFSGELRGPLTQSGAGVDGKLYNRRRDLVNPTSYMLKWQNEKF